MKVGKDKPFVGEISVEMDHNKLKEELLGFKQEMNKFQLNVMKELKQLKENKETHEMDRPFPRMVDRGIRRPSSSDSLKLTNPFVPCNWLTTNN